MEKLGIRSSSRRHPSSSQTDVSLSLAVAVKPDLQGAVIQLPKQNKIKKLVTLCLSRFCARNQNLSRFVCFVAGGCLVESACSVVETGLIVEIVGDLSCCVEGRLQKWGKKRDDLEFASHTFSDNL